MHTHTHTHTQCRGTPAATHGAAFFTACVDATGELPCGNLALNALAVDAIASFTVEFL